MVLSKKKIKEINNISFAIEILKEKEPYTYVGEHWTDYAPDQWIEDQKNSFDMVCELEERVKAEVIKILTNEK